MNRKQEGSGWYCSGVVVAELGEEGEERRANREGRQLDLNKNADEMGFCCVGENEEREEEEVTFGCCACACNMAGKTEEKDVDVDGIAV